MTNETSAPTTWIRRADAARLLGISDRTLDRWAADHKVIPVETKLSGVWYDQKAIQELADDLERTRS